MKKLLFPLLMLAFTACHSPAIYERYEEIPEESWNRYKVVEFKATIPDSGQYNVKVCVRHTTDFEMANLWCFISTRSLGARELHDTVNLKIAEPDGRWLGQGGTIKTVEQYINGNPVTFPKGDLIVRIEQGMRIEDMKGIKNVGIIIEKLKDQEYGKE